MLLPVLPLLSYDSLPWNIICRFRGSYMGEEVAIKVLRSEHLNEAIGVEFAQEILILRCEFQYSVKVSHNILWLRFFCF